MTRMLLTAATSSVLALAAPAVAQAHHGKHHHASHKRHHHAAQAHVLSFGASAPAQTTAPTTTTTPPTTPSNENAGTVKSFEKGVLTITLNDGTTVSGQVNESTRLECLSATPTETSGDDDQGGGDDFGDSNSGEHGGPSSQAHAADSHGDSWQGQEGGGHESDDQGAQPSCTTEALVEKAVVREAELSVSSAGAVWEKVELVK